MGSTEQCLSEGREVVGAPPGVARTRQIRRKSQVRAGAGYVRRMLTSNFTDDAEGVADVDAHPAASAIHREASAVSGRRIRPDVVIVDTHIHQVAPLCRRREGSHRCESENQQQKSDRLHYYYCYWC